MPHEVTPSKMFKNPVAPDLNPFVCYSLAFPKQIS